MDLRTLKQIVRSPLFIIALIVCASNWQLLLGFKSLQWDALSFWHPWRYFISECYRNGIVPLWDPFTQAGYPVHGDLQGPAYNPEAIATSLVLPASVYVLNCIFVGYLVVGGYGFYKLSAYFSRLLIPLSEGQEEPNRQAGAIVAGTVYALCGYTVGNVYFYVNISAALIPWIYYYYLKIISEGKGLDSCKLALFLFLQVTAGNPSFLIVSGYFLAGITLLQFGIWIRARRAGEVMRCVRQFGLAFLLLFILILPVLLNAWQVIPETTRAKGISLEWAAEERFALRNLFSFFTPLVAFERDPMSSLSQPIFDCYVGATTLFFAVVGFVKYRSYWIYVFSGIALVSFLLCLGLRTPVLGWFFHLPLFNVFRMPRLIFLYDLMFILLLASLGISSFLSGQIKIKWFFLFSFLVLILSGFSIWYFNTVYNDISKTLVDSDNLRYYLSTESQSEKVLLSFEITASFLALAIVAYWRKWRKLLLCLLLLDVALNYYLGATVRIFSENSADLRASYLKDLPQGFAPPENIQADQIRSLTNYWNGGGMNASIYLKQPCYWSDNNFELSNYMKLYSDNPAGLNYFTRQPLAFFGDSLVGKIDSSSLHSAKTLVLVTDGPPAGKPGSLHKNPSDTIICEKFEPQHFLFRVQNKEALAFVLQQNLTKLWRVKLDGATVKPGLCFSSFPLLFLKGGKHEIEFTYEEPGFGLLLATSLFVFCILVVVVFYAFRHNWFFMGSFVLLAGYCLTQFISGGQRKNTENLEGLQNEVLANKQMKENCMYVVNTRDAYTAQINPRFSQFNFIYPEDVVAFCKSTRESIKDYLCVITYKGYYPSELGAVLSSGFGEEIKRVPVENGFVVLYRRYAQKPKPAYERVLDFSSSPRGGVDVKKGADYSPNIIFKVKEAGAQTEDLLFVEADTECELTDFKGLVLAIINKGVFKKYLIGRPIHHLKNKNQQLGIYYYLPENTKDDDEIGVYLWNDDARNVLLKRMSVRVIRRN